MTMVERVGWVLVHFVWQGAAIALALWIVLLLASRARATVRYALGCGALALMLLAPIVTATMIPPPDTAVGAADTVSTDYSPARGSARRAHEEAQPQPQPSRSSAIGRDIALPATNPTTADWQWTLSPAVRARVATALPWLVGVWAIGVLLLSVRLAGGWWRTRALRTRGTAPLPSACQQAAARLMARMRIARAVEFLLSTRVRVPIVFGHVKPVVLVPAAVLAGLSPSQLDAIIAHELAHVRRHDYLVNLLQTVIETVLFYHPAVWWVSGQVRIAREECCDDIAVAACGDRRDYVEALLGLEQMRDATAALALGATDGSLLSRARRILTDAEREGSSPRLTASVIAMAVAALAIAGISTAATAPVVVKTSIEPSSGSPASSGSPESLTPRSNDSTAPSASASSPAEAAPAEAAQASSSSQPPQPVKPAPDLTSPLTGRRAWADREARAQSASRYWIGYAVRPVKDLPPFVFMDRRTTIMGDGIEFSGHFFSERVDHFRFSGRPLAIADADPSSIKVLFAFNANGGAPRLTDVHVSTMPLPIELNDRPAFWLGVADTKQSLELIDGLYGQAATLRLKKELVNAVEFHDDSPVVVAWLDRRVRSGDPDDVRAEAAEGLAWHPIPAALAALDRAARQDSASRVRQEAAEAVGDLQMPEAADILIALAQSLEDREARREAVEALGARSEQSALDALGSIATQDADRETQREAVETLGDFKDQRGMPLLTEIARKHQNPEIRREAIETLGDALPGEAAVDLLKEIAREDPHPDVQAEAVETLGDIDRPDARAAVQELMRSHKEPRVRREAIETIVDHAAGKETVEVLSDVIQKETNIEVRREAVERLADISDDTAKKVLIDLARTHTDEDIRAEAVETLGGGEWASQASTADVLKQIALKDRSMRVRDEAIDALAELPNGAGIEALIAIAREHPDQPTRKQALETLMDSEHPRARAIFDRALQKP